jgi:hypothetical protein
MLPLYIIVIIVLIIILYRCYCVHVYRFYSDTCPHCVNSKSEWMSFQRSAGWNIMTHNVNVACDLGDKYMSELYAYGGRSGVPKIVRVMPCGKIEIYDGPRTAESLLRWCM